MKSFSRSRAPHGAVIEHAFRDYVLRKAIVSYIWWFVVPCTYDSKLWCHSRMRYDPAADKEVQNEADRRRWVGVSG